MDRIDRQQLLEAMFTQSLDGIFFMLLDQPVLWSEAGNKEEVLEYVISHQHVTAANDAFCAQYLARQDQVLGKTPRDFFQGDEAQCRRGWRAFLDNGHLHIETEEQRVDGSSVWIEGDYLWLRNEKGEFTGHFGIQRDVTERHRMERELLDAHKRYVALFEQEHDAVFLMDLEGRHIAANRRATEMLGYSVAELKDLSYTETTTDVAKSQEVLQRLLAGDKVPLYKHWFIKKNGERFPAEVNAQLVYDSEDRPLYIQSLLRDISLREALAEEVARHAAHAEALNRISDACTASDAMEPLFQMALRELSQVLGVESGVIWTHSEVVVENLSPELVATCDMISEGRFPLNARFAMEDWATFAKSDPVLEAFGQMMLRSGLRSTLSVALTSNDERIGAMMLTCSTPHCWLPEEVALAEDVGRQLGMAAERLSLKKALIASEERYRFFTEITTDFSAVLNVSHSNKKTMEWYRSDLHQAVTGYTPEELHEIGGPFAIVLPEDLDNAQLSLLPGLHPNTEFRIRRKNGDVRWMQRQSYFDADENGSGRYFLTWRDITKRKELEAKALTLRVEQERTRILSQFIRDAAHEFRTPLSIVHLNLYATKRKCDNLECQRRSETSMAQVMLVSKLLDNMLTLVRLDNNAEDVRVLLDVNSLVAAVCDGLGTMIGQKALILDTDFEHDLPRVYGSWEDLSLAVYALLENAVHYTEHGRIQVRTYARDRAVAIEIQDSGIGMTAETQGRIFERFYRLDNAHTKAGFGLGLPIAQKVIESHGGEIVVESQPGNGSCFQIYLPVA